MTAVGRQPNGIIEIDGKPFFLAKDERNVPQWKPILVQTQEGDPTQPRRFRWADWSRGMGDSRGLFPGAIEYAEYAYLGDIGRLLPGPKINTIATEHGAPITAFAVVTAPADRVISFGGQYAKEIDPSDHTIQTDDTQDFGSGKSVVDAVVFKDQVAIAMGDQVKFWGREADGDYVEATTTSDGDGEYRYADAFGISTEGDLVRGRSFYWSKCADDDFLATNGNWTAEYDIGDRSGVIKQVFNFERWDYVLKEEGLYSFTPPSANDAGREANVLPDLANFKSAENRRWFRWYNRLFLCTYAGLYRYIQQGGARPVGIETSPVNESVLADTYPTAGVAFGGWAYEARYKASSDVTYIVMMRNAENGDATWSPFTPVSVIDRFDGECRAMVIPSSVTSSPEVWYARDADIGWFKLTADGQPAEYQTANTTRVVFAPTDLGGPFTVKYLRGLEMRGRNLAAGRTVTFKAVVNEGSENAVGSAISSLSGLYAERFWTLASNDNGRIVKLIVEMANDSTSTPPEVRDVALNYEERPEQVPGGVALLRFRDMDASDAVGTRLTAREQRQLIEGYIGGAPKTIVDPDGDSYVAGIGSFEGQPAYHFGGSPPQYDAAIVVRKLDYGS